jgi:hypothetical protein
MASKLSRLCSSETSCCGRSGSVLRNSRANSMANTVWRVEEATRLFSRTVRTVK